MLDDNNLRMKKIKGGAVENNKDVYIDTNSLMTESKASNLGDSKPYNKRSIL